MFKVTEPTGSGGARPSAGIWSPTQCPLPLYIGGSSPLLPLSSFPPSASVRTTHTSSFTELPSLWSQGPRCPCATPSVLCSHCSVLIWLNKHASSLAPVLSTAPAALTVASCRADRLSLASGICLCYFFCPGYSSLLIPSPSAPFFFLVNCHLSILIQLKC